MAAGVPASVSPSLVRFGVFEADLGAGELRKSGAKVKLEGQPFQILALLLEHPGQLVTREELQQKLWPAGTFVDFDHSINAAVKRLREALDDSPQTPRFIETLPRRGYRFIYPVNGAGATAVAPAPPTVTPWPRHWLRGLLALVVLCAALLAAILAGLQQRLLGTGARIPVASLAVLPLENLTGDAEQEYFVDGLHDELITQLAQIGSLKVISRYSAVRIKQDKGKSLRDVARELGVEAVMEGTVQRAGDRIHVSVQVIRAQDDRHLWARSYTRVLADVARLPSDIARAMAGDLAITVSAQEQARWASERTVDPQVYQLYLKASYYQQKWTKEALDKALAYYRQAIDLDPTYAPAWIGLGACYQSLSGYGDPKAALGKAKAALLKALELDDTLRKAHQELARLYMDDWDWKNAEREFIRAQELDPNWRGPSLYFTRLGLSDEAIQAARDAIDRDPLSFSKNLVLGWTYFMAGRYDEAIAQQKKTLELDPTNRIPHYQLAWNYARKGMYQQSSAECDQYSQDDPEVAAGDDCGWVYALSGQRAKALAFMDRVRRKPKGGRDSSAQFARIYDALGDRETAVKLLYQAYDERAGRLLGLNMVPLYSAALRADPRFQDLVARVGFPVPSPILLARSRSSPSK